MRFERKGIHSEQDARRAARRKLLRGLEPADLRAWLLWLEQRERIANACDRMLAGVPDPSPPRSPATRNWRRRNQRRETPSKGTKTNEDRYRVR
ncbi:hypothetical protein [Nocardia sp. NPDC004123]